MGAAVVTFTDSADLADRACRICGAVVGDRLRHRRWHVEEDDRVDTTLEVLRALTSDLEGRARASAATRHPSNP
jgi:hypothetical protein